LWANTLTATAGAGGTEVFKLGAGTPAGTYTFTLEAQLDHAAPPAGTAVENTLGINFASLIQANRL